MRTLSRLLLAAAFAVGASVQAGAVNLTLQSGTLGISIGALPPISFPCVDCPQILDVADLEGAFTEPASIFTGSIALPTALFTGVALIDGLTIGGLANGEKVIAPGHAAGPRASLVLREGGGLGGSGPLAGQSFVNVLFLFNLAVPLSAIGNTGASVAVQAGSLKVAVNGTGWTTGNVSITAITTGPAGAEVNTVTFAETPNGAQLGFDNRNENGTGVVQLISPFHIITNAAGNLPGLVTQTLTFVPEPGTILLLCSGVATLGVCGWLRARSRR